MKHFKVLCSLCLCALVAFSGCAQSTGQTDSSQAGSAGEAQKHESAAATAALRMLTPPDGVYVTTGMGTQEGYYLLEAQQGGGQNMKYIDFATAKLIYLSNDPSALHTNEADTSWMEQSAAFLFVLNEKLYCTATDFSGATVIFEMSPTGSDRAETSRQFIDEEGACHGRRELIYYPGRGKRANAADKRAVLPVARNG